MIVNHWFRFSGQKEHRHKDGTVEVYFPNGAVRITNSPHQKSEEIFEEWKYPDGTNVIQKANGDKWLILPNGQREVHTNGHKRREYPDGTVKIVYPDGSQESRYSNGRVRLKDKDGKLVMDSETIFVWVHHGLLLWFMCFHSRVNLVECSLLNALVYDEKSIFRMQQSDCRINLSKHDWHLFFLTHVSIAEGPWIQAIHLSYAHVMCWIDLSLCSSSVIYFYSTPWLRSVDLGQCRNSSSVESFRMKLTGARRNTWKSMIMYGIFSINASCAKWESFCRNQLTFTKLLVIIYNVHSMYFAK